MAKTEEQIAFIKWNEDTTELEDLFKGYKKSELLALAERQLVGVKRSWNKTKIAQTLAENTTQLAETIYQAILQEVLVRLPDLETCVYRVNDMSEIEGFIPLIEQGFFFVTKKDDSVFLLIPEEVIFSVKDHLEPEAGEKATDSSTKNNKAQVLKSWRDKAQKIYGSVSLEHLKNTWNRYYDETVTIEEIRELLN